MGVLVPYFCSVSKISCVPLEGSCVEVVQCAACKTRSFFHALLQTADRILSSGWLFTSILSCNLHAALSWIHRHNQVSSGLSSVFKAQSCWGRGGFKHSAVLSTTLHDCSCDLKEKGTKMHHGDVNQWASECSCLQQSSAGAQGATNEQQIQYFYSVSVRRSHKPPAGSASSTTGRPN